MILNDAKTVFIHPCVSGGGVILDNLDNKHKQDIKSSYHTTKNLYFRADTEVKDYQKNRKGTILYSPHIIRYRFDKCFLGNRNEFFFFTIVRNPWEQSVSYAKHIIQKYNLNIPFTIEFKQEINCVIRDIYLSTKYSNDILHFSNYSYLFNQNGEMLDYDYIVYFEDIVDNLKTLTSLSGLEFKSDLYMTHKPIDYREYLTKENVELISQCRLIDTLLFGYDFKKNFIFKNNQPKIDNKCYDNIDIDVVFN